jgi:Dolichyl-phosphate-mannose-protein mannosyltransferase
LIQDLPVAENLKLNSPAPAINVAGIERLSLVSTLDWSIVGTLALLIVFGFGLRVTQLDAIGFAEDEMNKLDAIHAYERGDFSANSEHPMVMKLLMWASVRNGPMDSAEAALRVPNALIGALTVIPVFLLTAAFFDRWTASLAAAFWAIGINAITHNRIGKEDSLLVFFMLFAFYFFVRAKQISPADQTSRARRYAASAISFGLMIASKYFPHYLGPQHVVSPQLSRTRSAPARAGRPHAGLVFHRDYRRVSAGESRGVDAGSLAVHERVHGRAFVNAFRLSFRRTPL